VYAVGRKRGADVMRPVSPDHPNDETFPGLLIAQPQGRLFFANAQTVADRVRALAVQHQARVVALDMSRVTDVEYTGLQMLIEGEQRVTAGGVEFWVVGLNPEALEMVRRSGLAERLGPERLLFNSRVAIDRFQARRSAAE
jgi:MFS superfamily sulfate permease-like transporter